MFQKPKVIIFLYHRFFDPIIQATFWLYIKDYLENDNNTYQFHLVTYENPDFPLTEEQEILVRQWRSMGLEWSPLTWHKGQGMKNKFHDILSGFIVVSKLRFEGYNHIIALCSVAGAYAYIYSFILRLRLFLYSFEPHSEYATDNKMWAEGSLQYKVLHFLEEKSAKFAKVVASGTVFMQQRVKDKWKSKANFVRLPVVANDKKFFFNEKDRNEIRDRLKIDKEKWVLYYPGKFGDLYYREEFAWMYKWLKDEEPRLHLLIVTPHTDEEVKTLLDMAGVSSNDYTIAHSSYDKIHKYASASDFAIISVPPGPSKKFISNIKVGEYLCAGLPFLITRGVSEDYIYAEKKDVGVVVDDFIEPDIKAAWPKIREYLNRDPEELKQHCRDVGLGYRGFHVLNGKFKSALISLTKS